MTPAVETLADMLDNRLRTVGLLAAPQGHPLLLEPPVSGLRAWVSPYAWLVLWPVPDMTADSLQTASKDAEACFDRALPPLSSMPGQIIDAYVVLALDRPPETDTEIEAVRHVRLERQLCRRTVVWPEDGDWRGLDSLPLLPLPSGVQSSFELAWPPMSAGANALVARLQDEEQSGLPVAKQDIEQVERDIP